MKRNIGRPYCCRGFFRDQFPAESPGLQPWLRWRFRHTPFLDGVGLMKGKDTKSGLFVVGKRSPSSSLRKYLVAATAGASISLVDYLLGHWLAARGLHAERRLIDLVLLAIFTGTLVLVIEIAHERERKRMNARSRTILLMNHHIRNALQSILDSAYVHGNLDEVHTSVDRIAWALQEILPGESAEKDENFGGLPERPRRVQFPRKEV